MTDRPPNQNPPSASRLSRLFSTLRFSLHTLIASVSLLLFKTLDFLSMDLLFPVDDDDANIVDRWSHTPSSSSSQNLDADREEEQLYFVPYRWWSEARESLFGNNMSAVKGDLYAAESSGAYLEPMGIWGYDMIAEWVFLQADKWWEVIFKHSSSNLPCIYLSVK